MPETTTTEQLREQVRERYAAAAMTVTSGRGTASCCDDTCGDGGSCCGPTVLEVDDTFGSALYAATDRDSLPVAAVAASLGCGNPIAVAELRHGEKVLDLGSGGGIDVLLSARRVGADRVRLRRRHDRRDARPCPGQRRQGRRHQCRVPQGHDRGHPAAGRHRSMW